MSTLYGHEHAHSYLCCACLSCAGQYLCVSFLRRAIFVRVFLAQGHIVSFLCRATENSVVKTVFLYHDVPAIIVLIPRG